MQAFAFPFRFRNGGAVSVDTASEEYAAQKIASAARTVYGELVNHVAFGVRNPTFGSHDEFDVAGLLSTVANHYADVVITNVRQAVDVEGRPIVDIEFIQTSEVTS